MTILIFATILIIGSVSATDSNDTELSAITHDTTNDISTPISTIQDSSNSQSSTEANTNNNTNLNSGAYSTTTTNISQISNDNSTATNTDSITKSVSNKTQLNANKLTTTKLTVNSVNGTIGKTVVLNATVKTSSGQKVTGGKLVFKANGVSLAKVNVTKGQATYKYTLPNSTKYTYYNITAVYSGTTTYASSKATGKLTVNKISTVTYVSKASGTVGSTITLTATVKNKATAANINGGYVLFKVNGISLNKTSVKNGVATIKYKLPNSAKNYTVTAIYSGYGLYKTSNYKRLITATKISTSTQVVSTAGTIGSTVTIKAIVKNKATAANITGGAVVFKTSGVTIGKANVTNGIAKITYKVPNNATRNTYTITATYAGNGKYKVSNDTGALKVKNTSTVIIVNAKTSTIGSTTTITATVKNKGTGKGISNGIVTFVTNAGTIGKANVTNGVAKITYKVPNNPTNTYYKITATYSGYGHYKASSSSGTLNINPISTVQTPTAVSGSTGNTVTLKTTVKTSNGLAVTKGSVVFWILGKKIGTATVSNGVATLSYKIPTTYTATSYNVVTTYVGTGRYKSSSATTKLTVKVTSSVPKGFESYVKATSNCQVSSSTIQNLAKTIKAQGYSSTAQLARNIFNYLNSKTGYSYYYDTHKGAVQTWNSRTGNCCDLAHLMIAVSRACNIPARYCHARCYFSSGLVTGHVWAELYVDGSWRSCDLTSSRNSYGVINNWYNCGSIRRYTSLPF